MPIPQALVAELVKFVESGEARRLYQEMLSRKDAKAQVPDKPLLYVSHNTSRMFDIDLRDAGIPKVTPEGTLVFHCCRVTFINLVLRCGTSLKDAMDLARHTSPNLTLHVYGRSREEDLARISN